MTHTNVKIDNEILDEIISILAKNGRPDLIAELTDQDYKPPPYVKKERLSESEGSAEEEEYYNYYIDPEGFYSLK